MESCVELAFDERVDSVLLEELLVHTAFGARGIAVDPADRVIYAKAMVDLGYLPTQIARAMRLSGSTVQCVVDEAAGIDRQAVPAA